MRIFLDIETRAGDLSPLEADMYVRGEVPGSYKKPESIDAWVKENRGAVLGKLALDSMAGEIVAIGYAIDDGPVSVDVGMDPRELLTSFAECFAGLEDAPTWIGHNILGFDIPWLRRHAARYRVPSLLKLLPGGIGDKWGHHVHDVGTIWASTDYRAHFKLSAIARFLGLDPPDVSGAEIGSMVARRDFDGIREHCKQDVELTRAIYGRITGTDAIPTSADLAGEGSR